MNRYFVTISILLFLIMVGSAVYILSKPESSPVPTVSISSSPSPTSAKQAIFYPMTGYSARITNRGYGKAITAKDNDSLPCGDDFSGLHTGDDLEVTNDELNKDMPVYAIADGTVGQVKAVNGYGGLLVVQHMLKDQVVTAYYGHIDLTSASVKSGDSVQAGQELAMLGKACSAQTSGERKHLHFALHKGTNIDVKGYVDTLSQLSNWLNPQETLADLSASEPK